MKKTTLFLMFTLLAICSSVNAQTDYYTALANNGGTSSNGRAPQALDRYNRSVWLISSAELTAAGFVNGDVINSIGFNYLTPSDVQASGTFKVYLQNVSSTIVANAKSTTWSTAITGMTLASSSTITIPATTGTVDYAFSGGSAFSYTGGAIYVATDYQNVSGAVASVANVVLCNASLTGGLKGARSATAAPTAVAASDYRPETRFGKPVACARPVNVDVPSTTLTSANLTFTTSNPANIIYGPYDFNPASAGTPANGISSPYTINALTASTAYEVYTKSDCGSFSGLSAFTDPISFHTTFQPADPTYNTSFEVDNFPNMGWVGLPGSGSAWRIIYGGTGSTLVQNGLYSALSVANTLAAADSSIISRGVNLQAGSPATISFYVMNYLNASTSPASYSLTVGADQTAASQTTTIANETSITNTSFALKSYTFTPATSGVYYFGISNKSAAVTATETQALFIDNFTVSQTLSNNEVLESKFSTYPNPAKNVINVANTTDALISSIEITDLNGRIVKNVKFSDLSEVQVSVSDLAQGVYTLKIVSDKGIAVKKVIKE